MTSRCNWQCEEEGGSFSIHQRETTFQIVEDLTGNSLAVGTAFDSILRHQGEQSDSSELQLFSVTKYDTKEMLSGVSSHDGGSQRPDHTLDDDVHPVRCLG